MALRDIFINVYCLFPILPPPPISCTSAGILSILFITLSLVSRTVAGIKEVTVNIYRKEGREGRKGRKKEGGRGRERTMNQGPLREFMCEGRGSVCPPSPENCRGNRPKLYQGGLRMGI